MEREGLLDNSDLNRHRIGRRHRELAVRWSDLYYTEPNPSASIVLSSPSFYLRHHDTSSLPINIKGRWDEVTFLCQELVDRLADTMPNPERSHAEQASDIMDGLARLMNEGKVPDEYRHDVSHIMILSALVFEDSLQASSGVDLNYFKEKLQDSERMLPRQN